MKYAIIFYSKNNFDFLRNADGVPFLFNSTFIANRQIELHSDSADMMVIDISGKGELHMGKEI